jgi:TPR repeat protein
MGVARTYDPNVIAALGSAASVADQNQALSWYRKALAAGELSAEAAIKRLKTGG